eukprot:Rmarinus@m.23171
MELHTVIVEAGTRYTRCGFGGEGSPRYILDQHLFSRDADPNDYDYFNHLTEVLYELFYERLLVEPRKCQVILCEPVMFPERCRLAIVEALFTRLGVHSVSFAWSETAALAGTGRHSGLVIDIGYSSVRVFPVIDGNPVVHALEFLPIGASQLFGRVKDKLGPSAATLSDDDVEDVVARVLYAATTESPHADFTPPGKVTLRGVGGSDKTIEVESVADLSEACDVYFSDPDCNIVTAVLSSLLRCPIEFLPLLCANVVATGGIASIPFLGKRIQEKICEAAGCIDAALSGVTPKSGGLGQAHATPRASAKRNISADDPKVQAKIQELKRLIGGMCEDFPEYCIQKDDGTALFWGTPGYSVDYVYVGDLKASKERWRHVFEGLQDLCVSLPPCPPSIASFRGCSVLSVCPAVNDLSKEDPAGSNQKITDPNKMLPKDHFFFTKRLSTVTAKHFRLLNTVPEWADWASAPSTPADRSGVAMVDGRLKTFVRDTGRLSGRSCRERTHVVRIPSTLAAEHEPSLLDPEARHPNLAMLTPADEGAVGPDPTPPLDGLPRRTSLGRTASHPRRPSSGMKGTLGGLRGPSASGDAATHSAAGQSNSNTTGSDPTRAAAGVSSRAGGGKETASGAQQPFFPPPDADDNDDESTGSSEGEPASPDLFTQQ